MRAPEFWHADGGLIAGLAAGLLTPLGCVWDAASRLRRAVAQPYRAPVPVICIGNLVAGGAGKTPVVLSLCGLTASPAHVVTRGYGGRLAGPVRVDPAVHDADAVGDEALLIAARAPCWVARNRSAGVRAAAAAGAAAVLLDDAFQNPTVEKDLALLVIDGDYGFGNRRTMPAGPLREPMAAGLARADAVVLLGDEAAPAGFCGAATPVLQARLEAVDGERFRGARVIAFAGIGRPKKFFATLRTLGAELVGGHSFADHHRFRTGEIARLREAAEGAGARLVTTAKDWVRLPPALRDGIEVLEVEIRWSEPAALMRLLSGVLSGAHDTDG